MLLAVLAIFVLGAAACAEEDDGDTADTGDTGETEEEDDGEDGEDGEGDIGETDPDAITFGWIPWEENIANTNLWAAILEDEGYDVELTQLDPGVVFQGVADGQLDVFLDVWLPTTHESYWDEFSEDVVDLGPWFEGEATLELTVPTYVAENEGITSLEDLPDNADLFDNTITGIEAGAGMMQVLEEDVIPAYGLDDYSVQASSTPAMREELNNAIENEEPIVVTLWTPHPEYGLNDLTKLEDPQGAWGEPEELHGITREGFSDDFPEVAEWLENFEISEEELSELSGMIEQASEEGEGDNPERAAAEEWIADNQDLVDEWLGN